jgi:hypothetical protein
MSYMPVENFPIKEMDLEPYEGYSERSWRSLDILGQPGALEPWKEVGRLEGLCAMKGDPFLGLCRLWRKRVQPRVFGY